MMWIGLPVRQVGLNYVSTTFVPLSHIKEIMYSRTALRCFKTTMLVQRGRCFSSSFQTSTRCVLTRCPIPSFSRSQLGKLSFGRSSPFTVWWRLHSTKNVLPNKGFNLPKSKDLRRLLLLAKPEKWRIGSAIIFLVISSMVSMAVPFCIGKVIDIIYTSSQEGNMLKTLTSFVKVLIAVFLVGAFANFCRSYLIHTSGQRVVKQLRKNVFGSIITQEMAFFDNAKTGELVNRLSTDTTLVGQAITQNISDGLRSTAQILAGVSMMFYVSPKLALVGLGIVPPVALVSVVYGRYVRNITKNVQDALAEATTVAEERISNIRTVRAFAQEDWECKRYSERVEKVLDLSYQDALYRSLFFGFAGLSGNLIVVAVLYSGGMMMESSLITVGQLSSFMLYAAWVGISIGGISSFYSEMMRGIGASSRLWEIVDKKAAIPINEGIVPVLPLQGLLEFKNVRFMYPSRSEAPIFQELDLLVPAGSVLAVVGSSGSGKSTLASLLLRYYNVNSGNITVDGTDIKKLNPSWLRNHIGTVSQEPILFSTTIAENIAYGATCPEMVTTDEVIEAAKKANAYTFIRSFPEEFNTIVGERGLMLSGGQRQRIAIARAILKDPKILILDEATSALDAESEYLVQEALERLMVNRTVIVIAHRLSTIRNADRIAVLSDGRVGELGSYDELMSLQNGMFRKLVERQTIADASNDSDLQAKLVS